MKGRETMKKKILNLLLKFAGLVVLACLLAFMLIYAIDIEVAFRDHQNGKFAEGCLFQSNCDRFNKLRI